MMESGRSQTCEQELKEPKRKKKVPGVIPNNPFPIIFWKKLGIPPCNYLWPCYNGLYDGEGVIFPSSEDISDIHSMGYFGRNVLEERGRECGVKAIPVVRQRQWKMMVKWATDFGYVITEQGSEDGRKVILESAEKEGESVSDTTSEEERSERFDSEETAKEKNESVKASDKPVHEENHAKEMKKKLNKGEEKKEVEMRVKECANKLRPKKTDDERTATKESRKEIGKDEEKERCMGNERKSEGNEVEKGNDEKKEEILKEVSDEGNVMINKMSKGKENPTSESGQSGEVLNCNVGKIELKGEIRPPVASDGRTFTSKSGLDARVMAYEPKEMGKLQNNDDFVEIIEEKSGTDTSENVNKNNGLPKQMLKRRLEIGSCNSSEKRIKKDAAKREDLEILAGPPSEGSHKPFGENGERKCADEVFNSSGECEIVEINDKNTNERAEEKDNLETDDDDDVILVDGGDSYSDHGPNSSRGRLISNKLYKDKALQVGSIQNLVTGNDTCKTICRKSKCVQKSDGEAIEIDMVDKEMPESEEDPSKCNDVEELKGRNSRNGDFEEQGSAVSSLKSDSEESPCIVIPDSDSDDDAERGPQWESDPSLFLPSLEWLKLFPEEAFFLAYGLGCVQVWDGRKAEGESQEEMRPKKHDSPVVVDSKSSPNASHSETSDDTLQMVPCLDDMNDTESITSDRVIAGCDETVGSEKERNVSDKIPHPIDMDGSIDVIDLVDSPPSKRQLTDNESSLNDDLTAESKQLPESMFSFCHKPMSLEELWNAFRVNRASQSSIPFETSYAVYHHFRSKGWVVKPGIKFGGDFLLYKEGPSFYHASYLVVIDSSLPHEASSVTWNTLSAFNRLAENVAKELMICRVEWPDSVTESQLSSPKCLGGLIVEEILVKRWVSMKERDADDEVSDDDKICNFIPLVL